MAGFASAGRLFEPFVEHAVPAAGGRGLLAPLNSWRRRKRTDASTRRAVQLLRDAAPGFDVSRFLAHQRGDYEEVLRAASTAQWAALKSLAGEQTFAAIRRGADAGSREWGARQGARIVGWAAAPALVHARVHYALGAGMRAYDTKPDYAQLTVRNVTLQQPTAEDVSHAGASRGRGGADGAPSAAAAAADASGGGSVDWVPVDDGGSGHVYWWSPTTGAVRWEPPSPAQLVVSRAPWRIETAGVLREPAAGDGGAPLVRVTHHVVWERCLRAGAPPAWRVVKL